MRYDRDGDEHYDVTSALIKSIRGSDVDAALHYLARMVEAGEDPRFVARRLVILASEDIGLADPTALTTAVAAYQAVQLVGLPEGRLPLAQAVIALALAPKSNAVIEAIGAAAARRAGRPGRSGAARAARRALRRGAAARPRPGATTTRTTDPHGVVAQQYAAGRRRGPRLLPAQRARRRAGHGRAARRSSCAGLVRDTAAPPRGETESGRAAEPPGRLPRSDGVRGDPAPVPALLRGARPHRRALGVADRSTTRPCCS